MEMLEQIIDTTIHSFDFTYCIVVNILTYVIIQTIEKGTKKSLSIWWKRLVLLAALSSTGVLYYIVGSNAKLLVNSAVLAPVFWSWIMKPICGKLGIDYKNINID